MGGVSELFPKVFIQIFPDEAFTKPFSQAFPKLLPKAFLQTLREALSEVISEPFLQTFLKTLPEAFRQTFHEALPDISHEVFFKPLSETFKETFCRAFPEARTKHCPSHSPFSIPSCSMPVCAEVIYLHQLGFIQFKAIRFTCMYCHYQFVFGIYHLLFIYYYHYVYRTFYLCCLKN